MYLTCRFYRPGLSPLSVLTHMVVPAGLEPAISRLRAWRPNQLDDGTMWRCGPDLNRRITVLQTAPLDLLGTTSYMAGTAGFEPAIPVSKTGAFTAWPCPSMEVRAGLEPVIAAVKELYPNHLDERTMCREISLRLCGGMVHNQDIVDADS